MSNMGQHTNTERDRRERGAALVEMALVTPLLVMLLFGVWTVARAYNVKATMDHAVREGARFAATVDPWDPTTSPASVQAVIDSELAAAAIPSGTVSADCIVLIAEGDDGCPVGGSDRVIAVPADSVAVNIRYSGYRLDFIAFSIPVDFSSQAVSRHEA